MQAFDPRNLPVLTAFKSRVTVCDYHEKHRQDC
jgi:hypothetical protein